MLVSSTGFPEVRGQRSEVGSGKAEFGKWKAEVGSERSERRMNNDEVRNSIASNRSCLNSAFMICKFFVFGLG
jgi:hypothetical protein